MQLFHGPFPDSSSILDKARSIILVQQQIADRMEFQALCLRVARVVDARRLDWMRSRHQDWIEGGDALRKAHLLSNACLWAEQLDLLRSHSERHTFVSVLSQGIDWLEQGQSVCLKFLGDKPWLNNAP